MKRLRVYWLDPDWTMTDLVRTCRISPVRIEALCADLPPRMKAQARKRQAPAGLGAWR